MVLSYVQKLVLFSGGEKVYYIFNNKEILY